MYIGSVFIGISGFNTNNNPKIKVKTPKVSVHPQLSISFLFDSENKISETPDNKNEKLKIIANVLYEFNGDSIEYVPIPENNNPTIKGMYQCLTVLFTNFKILLIS